MRTDMTIQNPAARGCPLVNPHGQTGRRMRTFGLLMAVAVIAACGFLWWTAQVMPPMPQALVAMDSDNGVAVDSSRWLVFRPETGTPRAGLILYPCAKVDPRAYAPPARAIAAAGHLVVVVPMPLHLAVFAPARATEVQDAFRMYNTGQWVDIRWEAPWRHAFAMRTPARVQGLLLWAAYRAGRDDLSANDLAALSIFGTRDGLVSRTEIDGSRSHLPATTRWVEIHGVNHAQFGWYGPQRRDLLATISREEQQRQVVDASIALLDAIATDR